MIPATIYTYWESQLGHQSYPFIEYCLSTFKRSGCSVVILTPENIDKYVNGVLNGNWHKITNIAEKVDALRLALIYNWGGFWIDSDSIIIKPFDNLLNMSGATFLRWTGTKTLLNGYFFAEAGNPFIKRVLDMINNILENNPRDNYTALDGGCHLGQHRINQAADEGLPYNEIPLRTFVPFEFPSKQAMWYQDDNIIKYITPDTLAIGLNLSQYSYEFKIKSIQEHRNSQTLFGSIIRYSEGLK